MFPNLELFTDDDIVTKEAIKNACLKQFGKTKVPNYIRSCNFGFVSFSRSEEKINDLILNGFVLCQTMNSSIFISLILVSDQYEKMWTELIPTVVNYTKNHPEILRITLYALPELLSYYEKYQFNVIDTLRDKSGEIKMYHMSRKIE